MPLRNSNPFLRGFLLKSKPFISQKAIVKATESSLTKNRGLPICRYSFSYHLPSI